MPFIAPELIIQAKQMDLLTYLKNYEPYELVKFSGNTYCTRTHDSLKISNGKWIWWSRGIGGRSALVDCQHFFRQIFLGYFSDIVQAFDTLRKNVCGDDYTSLHNPIVLSSVLPAYGMFHSIQILFL